MKLTTVGTAILSCAVLVGCGGEAAKPTNSAAPSTPAATPSATPSTTPSTVSTPGGTASTGSLPADFPKDVPVYAGATVTSGATTGAGAGAVFSSADATDKIAAFYKEELPKNGWSKPIATDMGGISAISATKEKRQLGISITKGTDGKSMISIGITNIP